MNEQELREMARNQVETLDLLQVREDLAPEEAAEAQADLEATREYWKRLAYPWGYERPSWFAKFRRWLMDWRRYPFN